MSGELPRRVLASQLALLTGLRTSLWPVHFGRGTVEALAFEGTETITTEPRRGNGALGDAARDEESIKK